ncbi:MAG: toprim domain-containing protein, partial [Pseudomonadota bacterium]
MNLDVFKRQDLHQLAEAIGLERPGGHGNYRSPHHTDRTPSLSIYERGGFWWWKDFSVDGAGGSCFDLLKYVLDCTFDQALDQCAEIFRLPLERPAANEPKRKKSLAEFIAHKCLASPAPAVDWLVQERRVPLDVCERAVHARTVGFNDYANPKHKPGDYGHCGPGAAFISYDSSGTALAVDTRYFDASVNGGVKTNSQGEKYGVPWWPEPREVKSAHTVVVVESAINALSVLAAPQPGRTAVAVRGTETVRSLDLAPLRGKQVILAFDYDMPNDKGKCPGQEAAWALHERCLMADIPALMLDQTAWLENDWNDVNDVLVKGGTEELSIALRKLQTTAIPGVETKTQLEGARSRLYLPTHDYSTYWRFRAAPDFTHYVSERTTRGPNGDAETQDVSKDLAAFRVAGISRIDIASP